MLVIAVLQKVLPHKITSFKLLQIVIIKLLITFNQVLMQIFINRTTIKITHPILLQH